MRLPVFFHSVYIETAIFPQNQSLRPENSFSSILITDAITGNYISNCFFAQVGLGGGQESVSF